MSCPRREVEEEEQETMRAEERVRDEDFGPRRIDRLRWQHYKMCITT